jgi:hypothetical protein
LADSDESTAGRPDPPSPAGVGAAQAAVLWDTLRAFIGARIKGMPTHYVDDFLALKVLTLADATQTLAQLEEHRAQIELTGLLQGILILPLRDGDFEPLAMEFGSSP